MALSPEKVSSNASLSVIGSYSPPRFAALYSASSSASGSQASSDSPIPTPPPPTFSDPFQGQHDSYHIQSYIDSKMAAEILKQTGFEVPLKPGQGFTNHFVISSGNFGRFCVGYAATQKKYVGIKILKGTDEVKKEAELHQLLSKRGVPHVLPILDHHSCFNVEGEMLLFQVMELAGLGSVFHRLKDPFNVIKDLDFKEQLLFCVAEGLLQGLAEMHAAQFYHLDVKPHNLVVRQDGGVFLIDFGCSVHSNTPLLNCADLKGDMSFFPPERHLASIGVNPVCDATKVDGFSAGLTLLFLGETQYSSQATDKLAGFLVGIVSALFNKHEEKQKSEALYQLAEQLLAKVPFLKNAPPDTYGSLVTGLLNLNPEKRLSPSDALQHPWFLTMQKSAPLWRKRTNDFLRELIQAQQREQRSLSPEDLPFGHFAGFVSRPQLETSLRERLLKGTHEKTTITVCQGMGV